MPIREPFDGRSRAVGGDLDDRGIGLPVRLALDVGREGRGIVGDAEFALKAGSGGGNQSRRKGGRAARRAVAFDDDDLGAGLVRRQRGA